MTSLLCFMAACHVFATSVKTDSSCTFQNDACDVSDFVVVLSIAAFFFFFFFFYLCSGWFYKEFPSCPGAKGQVLSLLLLPDSRRSETSVPEERSSLKEERRGTSEDEVEGVAIKQPRPLPLIPCNLSLSVSSPPVKPLCSLTEAPRQTLTHRLRGRLGRLQNSC